MLPVSGAAQLNTSGAMGERPIASQSGAYSRLVSPAPSSLSGRKKFQRPRSRALTLSSSMIGGTCQRVAPPFSWSTKVCSLGTMCLFMKSCTCSRYSLVFFEYSKSIDASVVGWPAALLPQRIDEAGGERARVHLLHRALQPNRPIGRHLYLERAARHAHRDRPMIAQPVPHRRARHRARRRAGGEGPARPPLPDHDVDLGAGNDARPLDVDAVGEG